MNGLIQKTDQEINAAVFDWLSVLADPIRCRLLLVLDQQELTVSEVCAVLQLPQSTVSRHLKILGNSGWVISRRDGTSRKYIAILDREDKAAGVLWDLVREQVSKGASVQQDRIRLADILATRRAKSQSFFTSAAAHWSLLRRDLFGTQFELAALPALLNPQWVVGDLGCGTGQTTAAIAPFVGRVIAVDDSEAMLEAAKQQLGSLKNVELRHGRLEALPLEDESLDAAILILVLHHLPEPQRSINEVGRVLRPGGSCLIVDMLPHDRDDYRQEMGHLWLGFSESRIDRWFESAAISKFVFRALPTDPSAMGPALFVASGQKRSPEASRSMLRS